MDKLQAMQCFLRVLEAGSFSKVAAEMAVSPSHISKQVAFLEQQVGAKLLQRTTRSIALTELGDNYAKQCRQILTQVALAESEIAQLQGHPTGRLRVSFPSILGEQNTAQLCSEFMQQYPDIQLDILLDDRFIDLVEEGFDLAIRASSDMPSSNLICKKIGSFPIRLFASQQYLAKYGHPQHPSELAQHRCIGYTYSRNNMWGFRHEKGVDKVEINRTVRVNSTYFVKHLVESHQGIAFMPSFIQLQSPQLVVLLPQYQPNQLDLNAVYPERAFTPAKTIKFIEFFRLWFNQNMQPHLKVKS
ncbi:LysR family transcriptional regulator [Motilimonas eburnea]|uniref:LysR family transcriptional regulator n=1 Tax=Motilimonas eburnea TaxID=1737488 RepID=UPI001E3360FE|nr:LysR family transcriptional regulator [Motilimonas eburnea]MCE2572919.1 LysR family transcriptional regulator [Motilimonas eburnea]